MKRFTREFPVRGLSANFHTGAWRGSGGDWGGVSGLLRKTCQHSSISSIILIILERDKHMRDMNMQRGVEGRGSVIERLREIYRFMY